jgi:hypothetical protein
MWLTTRDCEVCIGDWEQNHHRKFKEPVKGKGFRTVFRKVGYKVYLVDKFCTSCRCSACNEHMVCPTFRECDNPRSYRDGCIMVLSSVVVVKGCGTEMYTLLVWPDTVPLRTLLIPYHYVRYAFTLARPSTWTCFAVR